MGVTVNVDSPNILSMLVRTIERASLKPSMPTNPSTSTTGANLSHSYRCSTDLSVWSKTDRYPIIQPIF